MDEPVGPGGRRRLRLADLARTLGVSRTTVSNAFSRPDQLSADLRERVLAAARQAGYVGPDPVARMLRTGRVGTLGLVLPESLPFAMDDQTTAELLRGVADACEERRLGLLIVPGALRASDPRMISEAAVDGFIACSLPRDVPAVERLLARRVPLVVVDQPRLHGVPTVSIDDEGGARDAARHLVGLGHRRFAIVALPFHPDGYTGPAGTSRTAAPTFDVTSRRLAGYRSALAEAGLDPDAVPVFECAHSDEALGRAAAAHLMELPEHVTAVLAMSDRLALGVIAAARDARVGVPAQLSVVGFDDIDAAARSRPSLTTVRQPLRLKGYAAARLLLDGPAWDGRPADETGAGRTAALELPVELIPRHSTGPGR